MKNIELIFSFRDWRNGCNLLEKLGHNDECIMSDRFELSLEDWQLELLTFELNHLDIEFDLQTINK